MYAQSSPVDIDNRHLYVFYVIQPFPPKKSSLTNFNLIFMYIFNPWYLKFGTIDNDQFSKIRGKFEDEMNSGPLDTKIITARWIMDDDIV